MKIAVGTDIGRVREINEDAFSATKLTDDVYCLIVADGMGGHRAGQIASNTACGIISDKIKDGLSNGSLSVDRMLEVMCGAISAANKTLYSNQLADDSLSGMGTTVVAAVIAGTTACVCNVGDSRLYYISDGIVQITKDHSYVQDLVDKGLITAREAIDHPNKNIITRAVGTELDVEVDCFKIECEPGSKIVMCSDGLSNFVEDSFIQQAVTKNDPQAANKLLIQTANNNGGRDNITVINIDFDEVEL
ncbi:MAG: Stp1/IreP family PP2C-type Ser/Thr phosphatase [Clostridia bacterium]|nr:Stp1/IreP family PP2C-type Ser/Thr phosphatase [Clostridia bacterium]